MNKSIEMLFHLVMIAAIMTLIMPGGYYHDDIAFFIEDAISEQIAAVIGRI